jgi:hypothetical protein
MIIYGLMLMGLCMFAGLIVGDLLGLLLGISANIGGVGFAMLFLVVISQKLTEKGLLSKPAEQGWILECDVYPYCCRHVREPERCGRAQRRPGGAYCRPWRSRDWFSAD